MTSVSKNVYIDKLDNIVNEYNNTYHRTSKMKPIDVKDNAYINTGKKVDDKYPKFYKIIFAKVYTPNWSEEIFVINEIKSTDPWNYVINDLNGEGLLERFMKKNCERQIKQNLEQKK